MRIYFNTPAKNFNEALPLGNGRLGAMVYGLGKYAFNEATLWSGKPLNLEPREEMLLPMSVLKDGLYAYSGKKTLNSKLFCEKFSQVKNLILDKQYSLASEFADEWLQGDFSQSFMPFGFMHFDFMQRISGYSRELHLQSGLHIEKFILNKADIVIQSLMKTNTLQIQLQASKGVDFSVYFEGDLLQASFYKQNCFVSYGKCPSYASPYREEEAIIFEENQGIGFLGGVFITQNDAKITKKSSALGFQNCKKLRLEFNIVTGFLGFDYKAISDGRSLFAAFQRSFMQENKTLLFPKSYLKLHKAKQSFTNTILNLCDKVSILFQYGMYLHLASSNKNQASNLQGLWNESPMPAWSSNYTTNINLQMNYWFCPFLGKDESIEPLLKMCENLSISGAKVAQELYNARGWCLHHNSDLWAYAYPAGNKAQHTLWCFGSAWLVLTLCRFLEFNPHSKLKTRIQSLLIPTCLFYLDILSKIDGVYHTLPSSSPENSFKDPKTGKRAALAKSSALDISLLNALFRFTLNSLKKKDAFYKKLKEVIKNLAQHQINQKGQIAEWYEKDLLDFESKHRHLSQLYDLYPGDFFYSDEKLLQAAIKSLKQRGLEGTGWSLVWKLAIYARLKDEKCVKILLNKLCKKAKNIPSPFHHLKHSQEIDFVNGGGMYKNFTLAHPPFQIDASLGISAALMELFIQSHQGFIEILPCYFNELAEGELKNFHLKGGFVFSLKFTPESFILDIKAHSPKTTLFCYKGIYKSFNLKKEFIQLSQKDFL